VSGPGTMPPWQRRVAPDAARSPRSPVGCASRRCARRPTPGLPAASWRLTPVPAVASAVGALIVLAAAHARARRPPAGVGGGPVLCAAWCLQPRAIFGAATRQGAPSRLVSEAVGSWGVCGCRPPWQRRVAPDAARSPRSPVGCRRIRSRRPHCARSRARPGASPASGGRWRPGLVRGLVPATTGLGRSLGRLVAWARCRDSHKPRQRVRSGRSVLLHLTASHTAHGEEECP